MRFREEVTELNKAALDSVRAWLGEFTIPREVLVVTDVEGDMWCRAGNSNWWVLGSDELLMPEQALQIAFGPLTEGVARR